MIINNQISVRKPLKVLVVDDDVFCCEYFTQLLTPHGFQVTTDNTGFALTQLSDEHNRPDLVLLDIVLEHLSGVELCRHLKQNPYTRSIPVIAMSASGDRMSDHPGLIADGYLTKPFKVEQLINLVDLMIGTKKLKLSMN